MHSARVWLRLACGGLLVAATPAAAKWELMSIKGSPTSAVLMGVHTPTANKGTVPVSATVAFDTETTIDGEVIYNTSTCAEDTPGAFSQPKKADTNGKFTLGTIQGKLANGACPNTTFTFAAYAYTWTNKKSKNGAVDKATLVYKAAYGGSTWDYKFVNTLTLSKGKE